MLLAWCVLSLAVMAMGQLPVPTGPTPRKCCFDREYTATLGEAGGTVTQGHPQGLTGRTIFAYDFYRKRQGSIIMLEQHGPHNGSHTHNGTHIHNGTHTHNGTHEHMGPHILTNYVLQDYANRMTYVTDEAGVCTSLVMADTDQMYPPCIPADARYLGSPTFGYGTETMKVNAWEFTMPNTDIDVKLSVNEACVPVVETMYGHIGGAYTELTYFFTSYHPGLESLNSLNPPTNCSPAPTSAPAGSVGRRAVRGLL